jgi:hypothetical protein
MVTGPHSLCSFVACFLVVFVVGLFNHKAHKGFSQSTQSGIDVRCAGLTIERENSFNC